MEDLQSSEELAPEDIEQIISKVLEEVIKPDVYDECKSQAWIDTICEKSLKGLAEKKKQKYIGEEHKNLCRCILLWFSCRLQ